MPFGHLKITAQGIAFLSCSPQETARWLLQIQVELEDLPFHYIYWRYEINCDKIKKTQHGDIAEGPILSSVAIEIFNLKIELAVVHCQVYTDLSELAISALRIYFTKCVSYIQYGSTVQALGSALQFCLSKAFSQLKSRCDYGVNAEKHSNTRKSLFSSSNYVSWLLFVLFINKPNTK